MAIALMLLSIENVRTGFDTEVLVLDGSFFSSGLAGGTNFCVPPVTSPRLEHFLELLALGFDGFLFGRKVREAV